MTEVKLVVYPNPVLLKKCEPITEFNQELKELAEAMQSLMCKQEGLGLAAPQVGKSVCLVVCELSYQMEILVNPVIIDHSDTVVKTVEGCLSLPGLEVRIKDRWEHIRIKAQDLLGQEFERLLAQKDAVIVQHELDHLRGITLMEKMDRIQRLVKKNAYLKKQKRK